MLDFTITREQEQLRLAARKFAMERVLPAVHYFDEADAMPLYLIREAWEAGLTNLSIPKQYGGKGLGLVEEVLVVEEIAAACVGMATSIFDNTLGQEPVLLSDNEAMKAKVFKEAIEEFKLVAFATSEPTMGSDVAGMRCKAQKDGDEWVLDGTKYWITNGGVADYVSVFANADPKSRHKGVCAFVVDTSWDGVQIGEPIPKMGLRTSNTVAVELEGVRVPADHVLAGPGGPGFVLGMKTFARTRPIIGAFAVGAMRSAMELALDYAKKRRAFGQKVSDFQAIQFKLAEMYQKVETARLLTWKAAWEADVGLDPTVSASLTKFAATEWARDVVDDALQVFGGYGFTKLYPLEKIYRDVRVLMIYEGTSQVQRVIVGRHALNKYEPVLPSLEDLPRQRGDDPERDAKEGIPTKKAWRCRICGHVHYGDEPPEKCPYCRFPRSAFKLVA
ncbi:MAG: acyl-CoA dehydrogenase family protein [Promethearchaeota archaeon]